MDSLLANYASSSDDDDDHEKEESQPPSSISVGLPPPKSKPSLFSALPPPKTLASSSSSLFSSLPPPKSQHPDPSLAPKIDHNEPSESPKQTKKPIFSSLPPPKSEPSNPKNPKRVVQFTLPLNPSLLKPNDIDDDDDEEEEERKPIKDSSNSAPSKGLSSMLPAPKHSLCLAPSAASRRSIFGTSVSSSNTESVETKQESSNFDSYGGSKAESFQSQSEEQEAVSFEEYGSYPLEQGVSGYEHYASYEGNLAANEFGATSFETSYTSEGGDYGTNYASNWSGGNSVAIAAPLVVPEMERFVGKRGRNEIPTEIVEVNQAELMKNRPRADQAKVTGIAFGPAYQVWDLPQPICWNCILFLS